jgi:o-succinylbenzoate synthase
MTRRDGPAVDPGDALIEVVDAVCPSPLERIRVDRVAVPFRVPVVVASGAWTIRRSILVTLRDAEGAHGCGEIAPAPDEEVAALAVLASLLHRLDGLTPAQVLAAIEEDRSAEGSSESALASALEAGIETALLDLAGRRAGMPVAALLAGASGRGIARLRVPVSALVSAPGPADAAAQAAAAVATGVACVKLKVGGEPDVAAFEARVAAVRGAAGEDAELRLDANGSWTVAEALERLAAAQPHRIAYVEQPTASVEDLATVRRSTDIAVAADESVSGVAAARRIAEAGAADVLVVKPSRVGGAVETLRIAAAAADAGIPVVLSTFFETGIGLSAALHLAAALAGDEIAHGIATGGLLASDLLLESPRSAHGAIDLPDGPGLGVRAGGALIEEFRDASGVVR